MKTLKIQRKDKKEKMVKSALGLSISAMIFCGNAFALDPIVPSNFDTTVWARATENPPQPNFPRNFGEIEVPCSFARLKFDDPIAQYGQFGASPLHVFFGNTYANANSTYTSLRSAGEGTCYGGPLNRTAYYVPAMMNGKGKVVLPDFIDVFYRGDATTVAFPRGLKMIFGYNAANPDTTPWDINNPRSAWSFSAPGGWLNAADSSGTYRFPTLATAVPGFPSWSWVMEDSVFPRYDIAGRLVSPTCWNGQLDSADHRSHMAYKVKDTSGNLVCPAGYPTVLPEVTVTVYYSHTGTSTDPQGSGMADVNAWYLSSDRFGGKNLPAGTNFYVGMIPAWDDNIMNDWVSNILNGIKFGALGKIGNGLILEKPPTSKMFPPNAAINPPYFMYSIKSFAGSRGWPGPEALNNLADPPAY